LFKQIKKSEIRLNKMELGGMARKLLSAYIFLFYVGSLILARRSITR
jgi:hypothetical protein